MSVPFTPEQEARIAEIVASAVRALARLLGAVQPEDVLALSQGKLGRFASGGLAGPGRTYLVGECGRDFSLPDAVPPEPRTSQDGGSHAE